MKNKVEVIIFNEDHWGCLATLNGNIPYIELGENEDLYEGLQRLKELLNIEWSNEVLNYILRDNTGAEYIFIVSSKGEEEQLKWVPGGDVESLAELNIKEYLLNDLIERFKNGFLINGTRYHKEV